MTKPKLDKEIEKEFEKRWADNRGYNIRGFWLNKETGETIKQFLAEKLAQNSLNKKILEQTYKQGLRDGTRDTTFKLFKYQDKIYKKARQDTFQEVREKIIKEIPAGQNFPEKGDEWATGWNECEDKILTFLNEKI